MALPTRARSRVDQTRATPGAARRGPCEQPELSCAERNSRLLAALLRQGAGRRPWADPDFRATPAGRRIAGRRIGASLADTESASNYDGAESARRRASGKNAQEPRRLSP